MIEALILYYWKQSSWYNVKWLFEQLHSVTVQRGQANCNVNNTKADMNNVAFIAVAANFEQVLLNKEVQ